MFAETQTGVKVKKEVGIVDKMPDSGSVGYVVR